MENMKQMMKDQLEKLEKEKRDIEVMYDKLRKDHDASRQDNAAKEMENLELQLQLTPEARAQYQHEANQREEGRPKPKKKKAKKQPRRDEEEESEYEESSRGGSRMDYEDAPSSRKKGASSKASAWDEEDSPRPARKNRGEAHREKEMSILSARAARSRDY